MIKAITYFFVEKGTPTDQDLQECLDFAKANPEKKVILRWYVKWSGTYEICFDGINTVEEARSNMPKYYAV